MPARCSVWHLCFEWSTLYHNTGNIYTIPLIVAYGVGAYSITVQFIFIFFRPSIILETVHLGTVSTLTIGNTENNNPGKGENIMCVV